ncbi:sigma-54 interaction domain-containing protein [Desulfococcus sp.]|uniref:sigma-54 interaction domain-containing protein n=1 Tax=Desulfococcus sp. TaxID=2025834 RepID=UPI003593A92B
MNLEQKRRAAIMPDGDGLLRAVVRAFDGEIYVSGADYLLSYMNDRLVDRIGRNAVGEPCHAALQGRKTPCPFCVMDQVLRGETVRFDIRDPASGRWYQSVNAPVPRGEGGPLLLSMITDVHERKMAETALKDGASCRMPGEVLRRAGVRLRRNFGNIVGESPAMQQVYDEILNAAASDANVILYGEPGTGKELVAHAIHDLSDRRNHRFVPVHCGAIPENLFESEFFGYVRGAFSGANTDREGYIAYADRGTLFLDEIGEISPHMQVKLLRVIEGGGYTPVGSNQVEKTNVRIIGATNRDLKDHVRRRLLREDFYFRIHILPIYLPPLRERKEDLSLLIDHFLMIHGGKLNLRPITGKEMERLHEHDWPGNVRELQSVIIRYCAMKGIDLTASDPGSPKTLDPGGGVPADGTLRQLVEGYEKGVIASALARHRWHRTLVARLLGVDRKTLFIKMHRYGLIDGPQRPRNSGNNRPR